MNDVVDHHTIKILGVFTADTVVWLSHAPEALKIISALGAAVYIWLKIYILWKKGREDK